MFDKLPLENNSDKPKIPTPEQIGINPAQEQAAGVDSPNVWLVRHLYSIKAPEDIKNALLGKLNPLLTQVPQEKIDSVLKQIDKLIADHEQEKADRLAMLEAPREEAFNSISSSLDEATAAARARAQEMQEKLRRIENGEELEVAPVRPKKPSFWSMLFGKRRHTDYVDYLDVSDAKAATMKKGLENFQKQRDAGRAQEVLEWNKFNKASEDAVDEYAGKAAAEKAVQKKLTESLERKIEALARSIGESLDEDPDNIKVQSN